MWYSHELAALGCEMLGEIQALNQTKKNIRELAFSTCVNPVQHDSRV